MKRKPFAILAAVLGLFLVVYFASPLVAVQGLISAAKAGDQAALERKVNFPALRQSMKDEMNARLAAEMRKDLGDKDNALSGLGLLLAPSLISGAVDALVTPQAVAAMVTEAREPRAADAVAPAGPRGQGADDKVKRSYSYRGLNTFAVTLTQADKPDERLSLLMQRNNLFFWKLAGVDLVDPEA